MKPRSAGDFKRWGCKKTIFREDITLTNQPLTTRKTPEI
jgi:hypothetical protein